MIHQLQKKDLYKRPLISIVTISYNSREFIEQTIQSVINQRCDNFDFEYIVIDGGSTDGTTDIIRKYSDYLAYWHSKPDRGLSHAFNLGIEQAKGDWILFLNSDDYFFDSGVLSGFSSVLQKNNQADVVFGQVLRVSRELEPKDLGETIGHPFSWSEFLKRDTIPHPSAFTNMNYVRRVGPFDESYRIAIDYEFFLRGGESLKALFFPEKVTCMREGGMSRAYRRECLNECLRALKEHKACSGLFVLWYGNYLKFKVFVRNTLIQLRVIEE